MKKRLKVIIPILVIILIVFAVLYAINAKREQDHHEEGKTLSLTKDEERKVTTYYLGIDKLRNLDEPLKMATFLKEFQTFFSEDLQKVLDNNLTADKYFSFIYKEQTAARIGNSFLITNESIDNMIEAFSKYKGKELGKTIETCEFSYDESEKCCYIKMTVDNNTILTGKVFKGPTSLEVEF